MRRDPGPHVALRNVSAQLAGGALPPGFVIFDSGTVLLAPLGDRTPTPIDVEQLARVLSAPPEPPDAPHASPTVDADAVLEPIGVLVAHFDGSVLHAPSPASATRQLGPAHVRVLAGPPGARLADLPSDRAQAAAELVALGLLASRAARPGASGADGSDLVGAEAPPASEQADVGVGPRGRAPTAGAPTSPRDRRRWWRRSEPRQAARTDASHGDLPSNSEAAPTTPETTADATHGRVRVFSVFGAEGVDPSLALGMIVAFARHHDDGALDRTYDLRRPITDASAMLRELRDDPSPAVVLFADYSWTTASNLATSTEVHRLSPRSLTVHGGPHVPRQPDERDAFLEEHPDVDVVVRFEGERTVTELLIALDGSIDERSLDRIAHVAGTTVRTSQGLVHNPDRPRLADLDQLPSPYLTGEYDDVDLDHWHIATIETDRGCPFRCTFCDWGSATGTKPRPFDAARVRAEVEWIGARGIPMLFLADANFGGTPRDVEIARWIADVRTRYGAPHTVIASFAKNTTDHIVEIVDCWRRAGIAADGLTAIQTVDEVTLRNVRRQNIGIAAHDELTERFRERRLPLLTDLLIGLPGATIASFKVDLQRCMDLEVTPRIAEVEVLPNSPMNDPAYRQEMQIEIGPKQTIASTYSATATEIEEMLRLRLLFRSLEHFGLLRHVLRFVQHEHGIRAVDLIHDIDRAVESEPHRWPALTWVARYFDLYTVPPVDWPSWTAEVRRFLLERHRIGPSSGLDTVLAVQEAVLPAYGRRFPARVELDHDYAAWHRNLPRPGSDHTALVPLDQHGPGSLTIRDPAGICRTAIGRNRFQSRRDQVAENLFWMVDHWELDSDVARPLAANVDPDGPNAP